MREKYKSDPDEIKNAETLYLARLNFLLKIQTLNKKNKRFRQAKNDLPLMIKQQEDRLNLANLHNDEIDALSSTNHIEEDNHLTYDNLPMDLTDFFYEEINFDE
ncbi:hypothetical protein [Acinetobacter sp. NS-4]|uniref:hypothetical protein n=1 Tax=Acinetobacter sp. NS-4 TaxID=3127956 RepID=UPI00307F7715